MLEFSTRLRNSSKFLRLAFLSVVFWPTQLSADNPTKRIGKICDELGFKNRHVLHSLRKYWASTVAQQGMDWKMMLKMFGHSDFELILSTYYAQNDTARMVTEASKIDFGLGSPKSPK